jgi:hypothetical protein
MLRRVEKQPNENALDNQLQSRSQRNSLTPDLISHSSSPSPSPRPDSKEVIRPIRPPPIPPKPKLVNLISNRVINNSSPISNKSESGSSNMPTGKH